MYEMSKSSLEDLNASEKTDSVCGGGLIKARPI